MPAGKHANPTIEFVCPEPLNTRLREQAAQEGKNLSDLIRERLETSMSTLIICRPTESIFDARDRAISEGVLPAGSQVLTGGAAEGANPTCENQVGVIQVRRGERFAVQGPAAA